MLPIKEKPANRFGGARKRRTKNKRVCITRIHALLKRTAAVFFSFFVFFFSQRVMGAQLRARYMGACIINSAARICIHACGVRRCSLQVRTLPALPDKTPSQGHAAASATATHVVNPTNRG